MDIGRRNTRKYDFRCPDLMELRKLVSFSDDPKGFRGLFGRILFVLSTDVEDGLLYTLVHFYDPVYRCFTFPDYQLLPIMEEYSYLLGIPISDRVPFGGMEGILESRVIAEVVHLRKSDIDANLTIEGGIRGNLVATFLGNADFSIHHWTFKGSGTIAFPHLQRKQGLFKAVSKTYSLTNDDIAWYSSIYDDVEIIDSCGEFSNVPLLGTKGGINYNPALARCQLGFSMKDKLNNTLLEGLFFQEGKDTQGLKARMICLWHNAHRKGKNELGLKNYKLSHWNNTRDNQLNKMECLEQENRELHEEVTSLRDIYERLTIMMEASAAAQNQPPPPHTPL
ncbi:uncharacterized protein LOC127094449 [Lathyrus oleraceus]|uniref:uncharacterized protein LOC127094449 n=1 Tax=Pisum sativum TaxID=3888 RepID=UPI0021D388A4|nr:uncharacterized protein LOC127094449 [Pisum sativum]